MELGQHKLQVVYEVSARHNSVSGGTFTVICSAIHDRMRGKIEDIRYIFAAKEHDLIPDEDASLFVYKQCHTITNDVGFDT